MGPRYDSRKEQPNTSSGQQSLQFSPGFGPGEDVGSANNIEGVQDQVNKVNNADQGDSEEEEQRVNEESDREDDEESNSKVEASKIVSMSKMMGFILEDDSKVSRAINVEDQEKEAIKD